MFVILLHSQKAYFDSGIGAYNSHYFGNQGKLLWPLLSSRENETLNCAATILFCFKSSFISTCLLKLMSFTVSRKISSKLKALFSIGFENCLHIIKHVLPLNKPVICLLKIKHKPALKTSFRNLSHEKQFNHKSTYTFIIIKI